MRSLLLALLISTQALAGWPPASLQTIPGYSSTTGAVAATDTIQGAISKLNGNTALKQAAIAGNTCSANTFGTGINTAGTLACTQPTTSNVSEGSNLYFTNARAIASTLTSYSSGAGVVSSSDTILGAIQKLNGNTAALTTSSVTEGSNLYHTDARTIAAPLTGFALSQSQSTAVAATDTVLQAFEKLAVTKSPCWGPPDVVDDFDLQFTTQTASGFQPITQNSGTGIASTTTAVDTSHYGILNLATGVATTTALTGIRRQTGGYIPGASTLDYLWLTQVSSLSTSSDEAVIRMGFGTSATQGTDHTNGIYWEYNRPYTFTCTLTTVNGSANVSGITACSGVIDDTSIQATQAVTGTGIQGSTTISSINAGAGTAVMSKTASASGTVTATFTAGDFWIFKTANNSVRSTQITSTAVTANTWISLGASLNSAGNSVAGTINGATIATITTNIPSGTTPTPNSGAIAVVYKTAGTGASRGFILDFYWQRIVYASSRCP